MQQERKAVPEVILLDITLPKISDLEAPNRLRAEKSARWDRVGEVARQLGLYAIGANLPPD